MKTVELFNKEDFRILVDGVLRGCDSQNDVLDASSDMRNIIENMTVREIGNRNMIKNRG